MVLEEAAKEENIEQSKGNRQKEMKKEGRKEGR
jgi:hypothetical protein